MKGVCLCGSVSIEADDVDEFEACHCGMCRQWGGGPFLGLHIKGEVKITGDDALKVYDSSEWGARGFCGNCGTHLFYHLKPTDEYTVAMGLIQRTEGLTFTRQIFVDQKPDYYSFAQDTENLTEQEVFEKFSV